MKKILKYCLLLIFLAMISCSTNQHTGRAYGKNSGHSKGKHCNSMKPHQKDVERGLAN